MPSCRRFSRSTMWYNCALRPQEYLLLKDWNVSVRVPVHVFSLLLKLNSASRFLTYQQHVGTRWKFRACINFCDVFDVRQLVTSLKLTPKVFDVHHRLIKSRVCTRWRRTSMCDRGLTYTYITYQKHIGTRSKFSWSTKFCYVFDVR